ncbi:MAG: hypothetical protein PHN72_01495 [Bacilli bacterium]|nr:hypothetical protein [Bacilli bacterium]
MKKYSYVAFFIIGITLMTGCTIGQKSKEKVTFVKDQTYGTIDKATYQFTGESAHFYFKTGEVSYQDKEAEINISNFAAKKSTKESATVTISVWFNGKIFYGNPKAIDNKGVYSVKEVSNVLVGDKVTLSQNIKEELNPFALTTKDTFKESMKIEAVYCEDGKCTNETFKLTYVNKKNK